MLYYCTSSMTEYVLLSKLSAKGCNGDLNTSRKGRQNRSYNNKLAAVVAVAVAAADDEDDVDKEAC